MRIRQLSHLSFRDWREWSNFTFHRRNSAGCAYSPVDRNVEILKGIGEKLSPREVMRVLKLTFGSNWVPKGPPADLEKTKFMNSAKFIFFWIFRQIGPFFRQFCILERAIKKYLCKYYVYIMVISLSPVKRKNKNAFGLRI